MGDLKLIKKILLKLIRLFAGFIICAFGIVLMINASLGLSPWDVLHQGLSNNIGITIGKASITVGAIVVTLDAVLGENIGWGTVLNMTFIGIFMDLISFSNIIPISGTFLSGVIMLISGMICMAFGTVLYMGCGLGSGPRDGLMVAIQKRTKKPVKLIRGTIEIGALIVGYILGGSVGIGTVISAIGLGYIIQIVFKICKFDSSKIKHRFIADDIRCIKTYFEEKNKSYIEEIQTIESIQDNN